MEVAIIEQRIKVLVAEAEALELQAHRLRAQARGLEQRANDVDDEISARVTIGAELRRLLEQISATTIMPLNEAEKGIG